MKSVKDVFKKKSTHEIAVSRKGPEAEALGAERAERHHKRTHVALPLRITYWDKDKKPTLEMACTYDISPRGARISSLRCIKDTGEIVAVERGRNKAFCRVVWVGDPGTELKGQIGLQCVESERGMFEGELRDLDTIYQPIGHDNAQRRGIAKPDSKGNRRQQERFEVEGVAELQKSNRSGDTVALKNLSEIGCLVTTKQVMLPGTDLKLVLKIANYNLNLKGQVRHSALDLGMGIEFTEIRKGDQQMLKYLLQKLQQEGLGKVFEVDVKS